MKNKFIFLLLFSAILPDSLIAMKSRLRDDLTSFAVGAAIGYICFRLYENREKFSPNYHMQNAIGEANAQKLNLALSCGANPNRVEAGFATLQHCIFQHKNRDIDSECLIRTLLENNADPMSVGECPVLPIHMAIESHLTERRQAPLSVVQTLLSVKAQEQITACKKYHDTQIHDRYAENLSPLHAAIFYNRIDIVRFLLTNYDSVLRITDKYNRDALNYAFDLYKKLSELCKKEHQNTTKTPQDIHKILIQRESARISIEILDEYYSSARLKALKEIPFLRYFPPGLLPIIESYIKLKFQKADSFESYLTAATELDK